MATLDFRSISKRYGAATALDDISLSIRSGEFCSLIGPSGCGKTTLLRIAAGFVEPDRGTLLLDGADIAAVPPNRRGLGFVFQSYALFPTKTVAENIGFALRLQRRGRAEIAGRVAELCRIVHLEGLETRYPHEISGGQQQRVALARALAPNPRVLLLDEPLSALDARIRAQLRDEIRRIVDATGVTALYVTHDQEEALSISDRVAVMRSGRVLQFATPGELYLRPAAPFVADFVGVSNRLPCELVGESRLRVGAVTLAAGAAAACPARGKAVLNCRPEHVAVKPLANGHNTGLVGTLARISFLGPVVRLGIAVEGLEPLLWSDYASAAWFEKPLETGARVAIAIDPRWITLFEGEGDA